MERKFTEDEIVKALEICSKNNVNRHNELTYEGMPLRFLFEDTFDLIKRKNEEIHCLTDALDNSTKEFLKLHDEYQKQKAYIEKVKPIHNSFERELECAKQESIKEFAERLKQYCAPGGDFGDPCGVLTVTDRWIDKLVKEMTGENNGN